MGRPAFHLPDDQARRIAQRVADIEIAIPLDTGNHRPFVGAFIRAVYDATAKFYSPAIYQRLLRAYAPERRPSTATIATERARIMDDTAQLDAAARFDPIQYERLSQAIRGAIADELDLRLTNLPRTDFSAGSAELDFYKSRLNECERELAALRARAAQLATDLVVATERAKLLDRELGQARGTHASLVDQLRGFQTSADDNRKFALMAIEEARGEVRHWKDRCADLELQRQRDYELVDTLRRLVSQQNQAQLKGAQR